MRITNLRLEACPGGRRASAQVFWEQAERPPQTLSFTVEDPFSDHLQPAPEAFALACLPFAFWTGERRLWIEAALCPRLREGMRQLIQIWATSNRLRATLEIEAAAGWRPPARAIEERTAAFLSGGVDALSTLRANRLDYPLSHPGSVQMCLFLFGTNAFQMGPDGPDPKRYRFYQFHRQKLEALAKHEHFTLLPITTNVRQLSPSYSCWTKIGFGPATVAAAHLFSGCFTRVLFASDGGPLLGAEPEALEVPRFSSAALDVLIDQPGVSREQKLQKLVLWPAGMELIQPCHLITLPRQGHLNCGRCEKCLRTKLSLISLGLPINPLSFADTEVTSKTLLRLPLVSQAKVGFFQTLVRPLWSRGHRRLAIGLAARLLIARLRLATVPPQW